MGDRKTVNLPRFMIAAEKSGQGKTMVTCALLSLLSGNGMEVRAFKCGPDYIDPMFHRHVTGAPSYNLDSFFTEENTLRYLLGRHGKAGKPESAAAAAKTAETDSSTPENAAGEGRVAADIAVLEGVMGFYDGLGGVSERASAYEIAKITDTPVVLLVDASGRSLSSLAALKGFLTYRPDSHIAGVIFNRLSPMLYPALKAKTEEETGIRVLGYVPVLPGFSLKSRHLGLVMPEEIPDFQAQIKILAESIRPGIDMDGLLSLAKSAGPLQYETPPVRSFGSGGEAGVEIAVARDEAFCFYYEDNLELLRKMGAGLRFFSPIHDKKLPEGISGLYLGGGYPELHGKALSENETMRAGIREAVKSGLPCIAECGGFLYLKETMEDADGTVWPMAGVLPGTSKNTGRLGRFGYMEVTAKKDGLLGPAGTAFCAHEFHHWDSEENGADFTAKKPVGNRGWDCGFTTDSFYAGFPHLYFYSNPAVAERFLLKAAKWEAEKR